MSAEQNEQAREHYRAELETEIAGLETTINDLYNKIDQHWEEHYDPTQPVVRQMQANPELGGFGQAVYQLERTLRDKQTELRSLGGKTVYHLPESPAERQAAYEASERKIIALRAYQSLLKTQLDEQYANIDFKLRGVTSPESDQTSQLINEVTTAIEQAQRTRTNRIHPIVEKDGWDPELKKPHYIDGDEA